MNFRTVIPWRLRKHSTNIYVNVKKHVNNKIIFTPVLYEDRYQAFQIKAWRDFKKPKLLLRGTSRVDKYKISDLAKEFDITTRSIRFYEDVGLIEPERKGNIRVYQRRDKIRLKLILRGKRLGFSLAEIRELFELYDTKQSDGQLLKMLTIIDEKQAHLQQQLDDISVVMNELETAKERCKQALSNNKTNSQ